MSNRLIRKNLFSSAALLVVAFHVALPLQDPQAAGLPAGFDQAVIVATNSAEIKSGAKVLSGNVVVNQVSPGPTLTGTVELVVAQNSSVNGNINADSILLNRGSIINGLIFVSPGQLEDKGATCNPSPCGSAGGTFSPFSFLAPFFESIFESNPNTTAPDIAVAAGQTTTLTAGNYGHITIAQTGKLVLTGGIYNVKSIMPVTTAGGQCPFPCRQILYMAPSDVRVQGMFDTGKAAKLAKQAGSPATLGAKDVVFYVGAANGGDGSPNALPPAAHAGQNSTIAANIYAEHGTVQLDKNCTCTGAYIGRDVRVDADSNLTLASYFTNQPPIANAQTVSTNGAAVNITLTGSDPEGEDLTFSIVTGPSKGALGAITPIVPDPIPNPNPPPPNVQPPITSATVTYTPNNPGANEEDSFTFQVTDPKGKQGTAIVTINPFDSSPPPPAITDVNAVDVAVDTATNNPAAIGLAGSGPSGLTLQHRILTLPAGPLLDSTGNSIESVPVDVPGPGLSYIPPQDFIGVDSFQYSVRDMATPATPCPTGAPQTCNTANVNISVHEPIKLAPDQNVTTTLNEPVQITLIGNPGGTGTSSESSRATRVEAGVSEASSAFPGAAIAGNVSDANGDGVGDGRDDLPGPAPVLIAAGVDVNLGATPAGSVTDPVGDASDSPSVDPDPDLISANVSSDGNILNLSVRFAPETFNSSLSRASFVLDTDENPATGFPGVDAGHSDAALMGVEFLVNIGANLGANAEVLKFISPPNNFSNVGSFTATVFTDGYDVSIPLSTFDGDDGQMKFKVETQSFLGPGFTGILDYMPDLGLAPGQSRTGIQGTARIEIEWDIRSLNGIAADSVASATVKLFTQKGTVDNLDTVFLAGTADQDGLLTVSDFQTPAFPLPGVVMPVPPEMQPGEEGTFSFNVTNALKDAIGQQFGFFTIQGRVNEDLTGGGFKRGLQVRSTAIGNQSANNKVPLLEVITTGTPTGPQLLFQIATLPEAGTLTTLTGTPVFVNQTFSSAPTLLFTPSYNFTGSTGFTYGVTQGLISGIAHVGILIDGFDNCVFNGRDPGCSPH